MKNPMILMAYVFVIGVSAGLPNAARAADLEGRVCVVDGDTVMLGGKRRHAKCVDGQLIDLWGIMAFKLNQQCSHPASRRVVMCGRYSAAMLQEKIGKNTVRCEQKATKPDGTIVGHCFVGDDDINAHMVRNGFALAYRPDTERFTGYEEMAKAGRKGMWQTRFVAPWRVPDK